MKIFKAQRTSFEHHINYAVERATGRTGMTYHFNMQKFMNYMKGKKPKRTSKKELRQIVDRITRIG